MSGGDPYLPPGCTSRDIDARFGDDPGDQCVRCEDYVAEGDLSDEGLCRSCRWLTEGEGEEDATLPPQAS